MLRANTGNLASTKAPAEAPARNEAWRCSGDSDQAEPDFDLASQMEESGGSGGAARSPGGGEACMPVTRAHGGACARSTGGAVRGACSPVSACTSLREREQTMRSRG